MKKYGVVTKKLEKCPYCGAKIIYEDGIYKCPNCGTKPTEVEDEQAGRDNSGIEKET